MVGIGSAHLGDGGDDLLRVENLEVEYRLSRAAHVSAVSGVSLSVRRGESLGLVGESGCGKSSVGRAILQLPRPTTGSVQFEGVDLTELSGNALRRMRPRLQMIFQDPISSLNERRTISSIVGQGLKARGEPAVAATAKVAAILEAVGFDAADVWDRLPRSFSGGQCQRIAIARALVLEPTLVVCDEPVSALDVSVQAQILNLLEDMKLRYDLSLLFISHDLHVVRVVCDRVVVMYLGRVCEVAPTEVAFAQPRHPYTRMLVDAAPGIEAKRERIVVQAQGEPPSPIAPPSGCRFHTRCPLADTRCSAETPEVREIGPGHYVACHYPLDAVPARVLATSATSRS